MTHQPRHYLGKRAVRTSKVCRGTFSHSEGGSRSPGSVVPGGCWLQTLSLQHQDSPVPAGRGSGALGRTTGTHDGQRETRVLSSRASVDSQKWLVAHSAVPVDLEAAGLGNLALASLTMQLLCPRAVAQPALGRGLIPLQPGGSSCAQELAGCCHCSPWGPGGSQPQPGGELSPWGPRDVFVHVKQLPAH